MAVKTDNSWRGKEMLRDCVTFGELALIFRHQGHDKSSLNKSIDIFFDGLTRQGNDQTWVRKKIGTIAMMQNGLDYPRLRSD